MPGWSFASLALMLLLIGVNAFFVAAELAIVKVRRTRLEELAGKGIPEAHATILCIDRLDASLTTTQVGITIASVGVGWLGESAFSDLLGVWLSPHLSSTQLHFAFSVVTVLHVVLGEMVPKTFAIQSAESISLVVAGPLWLCRRAMHPLIWLFTHLADMITSLCGLRSQKDPPLSEEELKLILKDSHEEGVINIAEANIIHRAFEFADKTAADIMLHPSRVVVLSLSLDENLQIASRSQHARFPLCVDGLSSVVGIVNMKDAWPLLQKQPTLETLEAVMRPISWIEASTTQDQILTQLQRDKAHMACVRDGDNVLGVVTLEEVLDSLFGDLREKPHHPTQSSS